MMQEQLLVDVAGERVFPLAVEAQRFQRFPGYKDARSTFDEGHADTHLRSFGSARVEGVPEALCRLSLAPS
eukprot:302780-Heterocapsa_arctica.AAC.1